MAFSNTFVTLNDVSINNLANVAGQVVVVANDGLSVSALPKSTLTGFTGSQGAQGNIGYTVSNGSAASNYWRTFRTPGANIMADQPEDVITFLGGSGIDLTFSEASDTITWSVSGVTGYTGSQGTQGLTGNVGFNGSAGPQGYTGSRGLQG